MPNSDASRSLNISEEHNTTGVMVNAETRLSSETQRTLNSESGQGTSDDTNAIITSVKCRGPTILADVWNQPSDEKLVVQFNSEGQPYGAESVVLAGFIGTVGRNPELAPQGYTDWRLVPKEYKARCLNEMKLRFMFPRNGEDHIQKMIGRTVKDFRGELKATYYEPNKLNRTRLLNAKPSRLPKDQWLKLISYWDQDKTKRRAAINRRNQKNQTMPHCAGRQSFAQLRANITKDGVEPSRAEVFIATHKDRKTRDKKKIDEDSAKVVGLMKEKLQVLPNSIEKTDGKIAWKCDIYDQVIGKEERGGRVRGVGGSVCASKLWSCSDNHLSHHMEDNYASNDLVVKLLNDIKEMQEKQKTMEEKHAEEMRLVQAKKDLQIKEVLDNQNRLQDHISQLLHLFNQRTSKHNLNNNSKENDISEDLSDSSD